MDCKKCEEYMNLYFDGDLSPGIENELEEHLHSCKHCRDAFEGMDTLLSLVRGSSRPDRLPSPDFYDYALSRALEQTRSPESGHSAPSPFLEFFRSLVAGRSPLFISIRAAALLIAGFAFATIFHLFPGNESAPPNAMRPSGAEFALAPTPTPAINETGSTLLAKAGPAMLPETIPASEPHTTTGQPPVIDKSHKSELEEALEEADMGKLETETILASIPGSYPLEKESVPFGPPLPPGKAALESSLLHVVSRDRQAEVIESIQQHKMNLYLSGQSRLIPEIHKVETFIADIAAATEKTDNIYLNNLKNFQAAEQCLVNREYICAVQNYNTVADQAPGSLMSFLAQYQTANVCYEQIKDYKAALSHYQKCLENYPSHYISDEKKEIILKRIDLLTRNSMDGWGPLRLYLEAQSASPEKADASFKELINRYPGCSLVSDAIHSLTSLVMNDPLMSVSPSEELIGFFQQSQERFEDKAIRQLLQYKVAELIQNRLRNYPQAMLEYSRAVEIDPQSDLAEKANAKIQALYRRGAVFR